MAPGLTQVAYPRLDPAQLYKAQLPTEQEFLFEGSATKKRGATDRMFYGTGISYLAGSGLGGAFGLVEGLRQKEASTFKLRLNAVLNGCSRRGPLVGNTVGVLALMYSFGTAGLAYSPVEIPAEITSPAAGALAGALYKSTGAPPPRRENQAQCPHSLTRLRGPLGGSGVAAGGAGQRGGRDHRSGPGPGGALLLERAGQRARARRRQRQRQRQNG